MPLVNVLSPGGKPAPAPEEVVLLKEYWWKRSHAVTLNIAVSNLLSSEWPCATTNVVIMLSVSYQFVYLDKDVM